MNKFIPKNYKYIKIRKKLKFNKKLELNHLVLKQGSCGLKSVESGYLSSTTLEAARRSITRKTKKIGKLIIPFKTTIPKTKKALGVRMGKGSGSLDYWIKPIKKGKIIFELRDVPVEIAKSCLKDVSHKLPFKTKLILNN